MSLGSSLWLAKRPFQVLHVGMLVFKRFGEGKFLAIHDGGVVLPVGDDVVAPGGDGGKGPQVGQEARGIDQGRFHVDVIRQFFLQLDPDVQGAVQEGGAGTGRTIFTDGLDDGFQHFGVGDQPQVIVGPDHDHFLSADGHFGAHLGGVGAEIGINALLADIIRGRPRY